MDVVKVEQSISAHRQIRTPKKMTRAYSTLPSEMIASKDIHGGLLKRPPAVLSFSYPPTASRLAHTQYRQPPLLPLPISSPPTTGKANRARDHSLSTTPKKSKSKPQPRVSKSMSGSLIVTSTNRLGPEPNDIPKDVSKVLSSSSSTGKSICCIVDEGDLDKFSGSVFSLAPPPSSLPLPRFSVRPKLSCNAQVSGIDAGATDNLCRLLRLR